MSEINWVRELIMKWREIPPRAGREPFYDILASVNLETLQPDRELVASQEPATPEAYQLVRLWEAWIAYQEGHDRWSWTVLNEISRSLFFLPEPHILVGAAALLQGDTETAARAFRRGVRVDARYELLYEMLERYGAREDPPLTFLHRNHPLNFWLGKLRARYRRVAGTGPEAGVGEQKA